MKTGKKRSALMLLLSVPMFLSSLLFTLQVIFSKAINPALAVIAGVSLVSIVGIGSTIKEGVPKDSDIIF
jgi:hypothetical protein